MHKNVEDRNFALNKILSLPPSSSSSSSSSSLSLQRMFQLETHQIPARIVLSILLWMRAINTNLWNFSLKHRRTSQCVYKPDWLMLGRKRTGKKQTPPGQCFSRFARHTSSGCLAGLCTGEDKQWCTSLASLQVNSWKSYTSSAATWSHTPAQ